MGQITRAYTSTGAIRFDALAEIRSLHPELKELSWSNVYTRPDLQIRAVVFKMKDNYQYYIKYADSDNALAFADAAYNGGIGGLDKERRACKISNQCDPALWVGNVEKFCMKSKAALYGQRSACNINRHHVKDVLEIRAPKYRALFLNKGTVWQEAVVKPNVVSQPSQPVKSEMSQLQIDVRNIIKQTVSSKKLSH